MALNGQGGHTTPPDDAWEPRVVGGDGDGWPLAFRVGATGAGAGAGCGLGIGFGKPLGGLTSIPVLGQAAAGLTTGLSAFTASAGPLAGAAAALSGGAGAARGAVRGLGVQGLDAGIGCGVGVGYGFFVAGLMVKPSAFEAIQAAARQAAGSVAGTVQTALGAAGIHLPSGTSTASTTSSAPHQHPALPSSLLAAAAVATPSPLQQHNQQQHQHHQQQPVASDREVLRALLRHERQIQKLRRQNWALREALCKVDPKASVCAVKQRGSGSSGGGLWGSSSGEGGDA